MTFAAHLEKDRRLVLLKALEASAAYRANAFLLRSYCDAVGHTVSMDRIEQDLTWLAEQGLVTVERPAGVAVATLTERGLDVATARVTVPGVQRPQPGI